VLGGVPYTGGLGADTFVIAEKGFTDIIADFKSGNDRIDLSALGINENSVSFDATGKILFADVDGNGTPDLAIVSQADQIQVSDILFA
jgi:Ca2+-binding RTX toxin-like protein